MICVYKNINWETGTLTFKILTLILTHLPYNDRWDAWVECASQCCSDVRRRTHSSCSGTVSFCHVETSCGPPALIPSLVLAWPEDWPRNSRGLSPPHRCCCRRGVLMLDLLAGFWPFLVWLWAQRVWASAVVGSHMGVAGSSLWCPDQDPV